MQIFILNNDIENCAKAYCDKHIVKIPTEICQILCTVARQKGCELPEFCYKSTHEKHPCVLWCSESTGNFVYCLRLGFALLEEYYYRFGEGKHQRAKQILEYFDIPKNIPQFETGAITPFAQAIPKKYKSDDAVTSYRAYYCNCKLKNKNGQNSTWTNRQTPQFIKDFLNA